MEKIYIVYVPDIPYYPKWVEYLKPTIYWTLSYYLI